MLKDIWTKKGFSFREKKDGFVAKKMNRDYFFIGRNGAKYNSRYYKKTSDGWIYLLKNNEIKLLDLCVGLA